MFSHLYTSDLFLLYHTSHSFSSSKHYNAALFHLSKQLASHTQRVADTHRDTIKAALNEKTPEDRIVEVAASLGDLGSFLRPRLRIREAGTHYGVAGVRGIGSVSGAVIHFYLIKKT